MPHKSKILLLDTGKEWGGGTNSMLELLKRINRDKFDITCCFYSDYSRAEGETIGQVLNGIGIPLIVIPQRQQPVWAKLLKEAGRSLLFFSRGAAKHLRVMWISCGASGLTSAKSKPFSRRAVSIRSI
ncbi:group 1 glycosyl transferase [Enterobacter asburiae]|uniref:Group 1 glycosyl transferase n=1 Tax=Enterobacter asburiae TaxID=61645 RepID=A0A376FHZ2_ENTAS|nr:group 1 glycosyl transferase [Enterobacter asburiae]